VFYPWLPFQHRCNVVFSWFRSGRRKKLLAQPLASQWQTFVERNVAIYSRLSAAQQRKLVDAVKIIAAERRFVGCKGLVVTDEMKVTIAAQAALLLLGEEGYYFERVTSFLLYPFKMVLPAHGVRPSSDEDDFDERVILGQAFQQGEIILSWPDVLSGGRVADDGENVVLHELAHHLDGLDGQMGGSPPGLARDRQDHFHDVFEAALERLQRDLEFGRETILLPAAAESATELFAYGTEAFFERPRELERWDAELFACFREFYKVDPREWFAGKSVADMQAIEDENEDEDENEAVSGDLPPLETTDQYFARGQELLAEGRWEQAAADFNCCVRLDPADEEAIVWRGRSYLFAGHVEAALADAERACRLAPDDGEAQSLRGMCLTALGRYEDALAAFNEVGPTVADDAEALVSRGIAHSEVGNLHAAVSDFTDVIEQHPDDAEAWYERSLCHQQLGNVEQAQSDAERARGLGWEGEAGRERDGKIR
jgi:Mlc titration factor MtfA (ptsG expression regulator)/Flp pilus assembly protein TadD